jgi:hypothetical protein
MFLWLIIFNQIKNYTGERKMTKVTVETNEVVELTEQEKDYGIQLINGVKHQKCQGKGSCGKMLPLTDFHVDNKNFITHRKRICAKDENRRIKERDNTAREKAAVQDAIELLKSKGYKIILD